MSTKRPQRLACFALKVRQERRRRAYYSKPMRWAQARTEAERYARMGHTVEVVEITPLVEREIRRQTLR